ncbi:MAG: hypothetical protein Q8T11_16720 [Elusimicrobiota bacterium]|nr:hypothetical protein [Elusimicrobiota bacterium]
MKRTDAASALLLGLCLFALLARLSVVPALSLDEAWIGLFAERLRQNGPYTVHEMNNYTGTLYGWLVAAFYEARGLSLQSLRLPGALLNAAALVGVWLHLRRRLSPEAAASWALLCAGSAYFLMKSRLAWEVYALHPILILGTLALLARPGAAAGLTALTMIGVHNHFIYLSIPASLVVLFGARAAWRGEAQAEGRLRDASSALAAGVVLALLEISVTDALWNAHRPALLAALILLPAAAAAAVWRAPTGLLLLPFTRARRPLTILLGLTIAAFAGWHLVPMVQVFAGPVVFKRLFSLDLPAALDLPLYAWGLFLAGLLAWNSVRAWHDESLGFHERTVLLWPAAFAAVFIVFRHTSSLRYYSLPALLAAAALAAALPRLARADKRFVYACALAVALTTQGLLLRELAAPADRTPLKFRVGWRKENSKDFSRKEGLFAAFDASGACGVAHPERSFTAIPLFFYGAGRPAPACDPALAFDSDQCPECAAPPFYRWAVVPVAK